LRRNILEESLGAILELPGPVREAIQLAYYILIRQPYAFQEPYYGLRYLAGQTIDSGAGDPYALRLTGPMKGGDPYRILL
jgi:hypothetical protein